MIFFLKLSFKIDTRKGKMTSNGGKFRLPETMIFSSLRLALPPPAPKTA